MQARDSIYPSGDYETQRQVRCVGIDGRGDPGGDWIVGVVFAIHLVDACEKQKAFADC